MIGIRKLLDYCFTKRELKILDDTIPEINRKNYINDENMGYCAKISKCILGPKVLKDKQYNKCNQISKDPWKNNIKYRNVDFFCFEQLHLKWDATKLRYDNKIKY